MRQKKYLREISKKFYHQIILGLTRVEEKFVPHDLHPAINLYSNTKTTTFPSPNFLKIHASEIGKQARERDLSRSKIRRKS